MLPVKSFETGVKAEDPSRSTGIDPLPVYSYADGTIRTKETNQACGGLQESKRVDASIGDRDIGERLRGTKSERLSIEVWFAQ